MGKTYFLHDEDDGYKNNKKNKRHRTHNYENNKRFIDEENEESIIEEQERKERERQEKLDYEKYLEEREYYDDGIEYSPSPPDIDEIFFDPDEDWSIDNDIIDETMDDDD